jgi:HAD superfamily hydrolase (TIGR01509 family)
MFDGVIFDCDGVLVDSEKIGVHIDRRVLAEVGLDFTIEEVVGHFMGKSDKHFVETVESMLGKQVPENWLDEISKQYQQAFENELTPVPGIVEALDELELAHCVASSGTHEKMRFTLGKTGLLNRFQNKLFSATEVERGKPHPDLFLYAASQMGWAPERCAVVEDSQAGVQAGLAAGMKVVAYAGGFLNHDDVEHENLVVIQHMSELPRLLSEPSLWSKN